MKAIGLTIFILFISTLSVAQSPQLNRDPAMVKFVTSDIDNFWSAYDLARILWRCFIRRGCEGHRLRQDP
jgi:hypothetical protein